MSTPDTMDTIDEAEQAWREYENNSIFFKIPPTQIKKSYDFAINSWIKSPSIDRNLV